MKKIFSYLFCILSIAGFIFGLMLFIEASQPCSGDGCLIHVLYLAAIPVLIISGVLLFLSIKAIRKMRLESNSEI